MLSSDGGAQAGTKFRGRTHYLEGIRVATALLKTPPGPPLFAETFRGVFELHKTAILCIYAENFHWELLSLSSITVVSLPVEVREFPCSIALSPDIDLTGCILAC